MVAAARQRATGVQRRGVWDNALGQQTKAERIREINKMAKRTLLITPLLTLVVAAGALAAGPLHGKTYKTTTPNTGNNSRNQRAGIPSVPLVLKVSGNGKTVTVSFPSNTPILYCTTKKELAVQSTKPAKIARNGSFVAKVGQRFSAGPGEPAVLQVVSGTFSGHTVHGTIRTEAPPCGGTASFTAKV